MRHSVPGALAVLVLVLLTGCSAGPTPTCRGRPTTAPSAPSTSAAEGGTSSSPTAPSRGSSPAASPSSTSGTRSATAPRRRPPVDDPYVQLARDLHARGVQIWFDTDLVGSWLRGPQAFRQTVSRLGDLATVRGTVGFKIADELGYDDGLRSPTQARRFLRDSREALARVAPRARILVDAYVPELGCLAWTGPVEHMCGSKAGADYPAVSLDAMTSYLCEGLIDVLDLSTGLLEPTVYRRWGTTPDRAQVRAWQHVEDLGWDRHAVLQSRKAFAAPGGYLAGRAHVESDVRTYVTLPILGGARRVDLWTWRQAYDGTVVSLLPDSLEPTPFWHALEGLRRDGVDLVTNMTPSAVPDDPLQRDRECDLVASVFSTVLVAAGTG